MSQLVTFTLGDHLFGLDVSQVQEVMRGQARTRVPLAPDTMAGLINLRGQVLTAVELRAVLGLPTREEGDKEMMVLVRHNDELVALMVDSIGAVVDVSMDQFEAPPETLGGPHRELIRGAFKLDRRLLLSLDIDRALSV